MKTESVGEMTVTSDFVKGGTKNPPFSFLPEVSFLAVTDCKQILFFGFGLQNIQTVK